MGIDNVFLAREELRPKLLAGSLSECISDRAPGLLVAAHRALTIFLPAVSPLFLRVKRARRATVIFFSPAGKRWQPKFSAAFFNTPRHPAAGAAPTPRLAEALSRTAAAPAVWVPATRLCRYAADAGARRGRHAWRPRHNRLLPQAPDPGSTLSL